MECESIPKGYTPIVLSGEELTARLAVALQTPGKMQYTVLENEQGQLIFPAPPSPTVQIATMDSASRLRLNSATGSVPVAEDNSGTILTFTDLTWNAARGVNARPLFGNTPSVTTVAAANAVHTRFGAVRVTLVGGALADVELVPALAGFHSVISIHSVWSPTVDVYNLILQDEDDAGLVPDLDAGVNVEIKGINEISPYATTHGAAGDNSGAPPEDPAFHTQAVNHAIEVDVVGAGVQVIIIFFSYWYEAVI